MKITQGKWFWLGVLLVISFNVNSQNLTLVDSIYAPESSASMLMNGTSMSVDGNTMFVFADRKNGSELKRIVLVHQRQTTSKWIVVQELTSSSISGSFGTQLAIHGDYAVISASESGFHIYERNSQGLWEEVQWLNGYNGSVAIHGERIVTGDSLHVYNH
ncbi:MAG: hypothetical protein ACJAWV_002972 [Flammeovirgaceae bacterium]|jgi:hypothetical protein